MPKKQAKQSNMRDSNIELFRIISMLLIVFHHYVVNSGLNAVGGPIYVDPLSFKSLFLLTGAGFGKIGINCFVLITGYFMCKSQISAKKFAKLFFEVMFYRVLIALVFWVSGYEPFTLASLLNCLIPFKKVALNFTGTYLIFFLCIPFLNRLLHSLTEKQHLRLLVLSVFTYVVFGSIPSFSVTMNYVSWYIVLYFTASYIRMYPKKQFENTKLWGWVTAACVIFCCASVVFGTWLGSVTGKELTYYFVVDCNKFLAYFTGISAFLFFKNVKIKPSKVINTISATTFGVLMIHANSDVMRRWLWGDLLHNVQMYGSEWLYVHAVGGVIALFAVCSVIDMLRIRFVEKPFFAWWDTWFGKVEKAYVAAEDKVCKKLNIGN